MATIVDGVRQKPAPAKTQGFTASETTDTYYYLYNVDAKAFFTEGNAWGTQASIGDTGLKVAFTADGEYTAAYLFNDFSIAKNAWKLVFFDNENSMFVDLGSQANYRWGVEENGETFRLFAASEENGNPGWAATTDAETGEEIEHPAYREGQYVGWKAGSSSTAMSPYLPVEEGNCINWAFVTEEDYTAYAALVDVYVVAEKLRALIEEVKAKGFTATAEYEALYANEGATKAELEAAITALNAAFVEWGKNNATWDNPADMTSKIVNPRFDNNDLTTGWSTKFNANGGKENAEYWNMNYNTYQDIKGLPEGVYALGVNAFYRAGSNSSTAIENWLAHNEASKYAKLYSVAGGVNRQTAIANVFSGAQTSSQVGGEATVTYTDPESGEEVTVYVPNNMTAAEYYMHTLGQYANKLFLTVAEGDTLRIGVKKDVNIGDEWSIFDDFSLTYYGKGADACKHYLEEAMKDYSDYTIDEGVLFTQKYLDEYQAAYSGEKTANSLEEVNNILKAIDETKAALDKNIALWKEYVDLANKAKTMVTEADYQGMDETYELADYLDATGDFSGCGYEDILDALSLTNEELETEIARMNDWMNTMIEKSKLDVYDGKIMTKFINNPGFDQDADINSGAAEGWTIDRVDGGNVVRGPLGQSNQNVMINALGEQNFCFESWHCHKWDVWQEVKNLPVGMYELSVQGYVRCEVGGYTAGDPLEGDYVSPVNLYMNNALSSVPSVYSEQIDESHYNADGELPMVESHSWNGAIANYPNSMGAASLCFKWGMYKTKAYGLIAKEGDTFRIGVKMDKNQDWWCIWDNFQLVYRVPTVEVVKPILEEALAGLNLDQPMGKNIFEQVSNLKTEAEAAIAAGDGQALFNILAKVYDMNAAIQESVALFAELQKANEFMNDAISEAVNAAGKSQANALYIEIQNGIDNHEIADEEVEGYMEKIDLAFTAMALPTDIASASDSDPKEVTAAIKCPSFEKDYENNAYGWNNAGNLGNDDEQKGALAMEFWQNAFDMFQTIKGLPAGTYELTVDAWVRNGANDENYTAWQANPENSMALLYAVDGDSTVYTSTIANMMAAGDALMESAGYSGETEFTAGDKTFYVPGSLVSGKGIIDMNPGIYTNKAIVKVKEDGKLTIGIKKAQYKDNSWVVCDDFKLFYLGANSSATPSDDLTGIDTVEGKTAKVEYFTLDGRKANSTHKGIMIQKVTLSNGTTLIQKIRN